LRIKKVQDVKVDNPTGGEDPHRAFRRRRYDDESGGFPW
jgi:hypothetical protein